MLDFGQIIQLSLEIRLIRFVSVKTGFSRIFVMVFFEMKKLIISVVFRLFQDWEETG